MCVVVLSILFIIVVDIDFYVNHFLVNIMILFCIHILLIVFVVNQLIHDGKFDAAYSGTSGSGRPEPVPVPGRGVGGLPTAGLPGLIVSQMPFEKPPFP